jgi:hypothetical protein
MARDYRDDAISNDSASHNSSDSRILLERVISLLDQICFGSSDSVGIPVEEQVFLFEA